MRLKDSFFLELSTWAISSSASSKNIGKRSQETSRRSFFSSKVQQARSRETSRSGGPHPAITVFAQRGY